MAQIDETTVPPTLLYTTSHEWIRVEGLVVTVGITHFAQEALGDVVYVEFPDIGQTLDEEEDFGVVESVKAVSDLYAPVTGTVVEVNLELEEQWEALNQDPYRAGWIIKMEIENESALDGLLDAEGYAEFLQQ